MIGRQRHAAVDGADEAEVVLVFQQHDAFVGGGDGAQPVGDFGLGAGVVDEDQAPGGLALRGQHRLDAAAGVVQPAVDGHDDVDGVGRGRQGLRHDGFLGGGARRASTQQAVDAHLGVHDGAGGAEHGGVLDVVHQLAGLVALLGQAAGGAQQRLLLLAQVIVLLAQVIVLLAQVIVLLAEAV